MEKKARCRKATLAIAALLVAGALYPMTALGAQKLLVKDSGGSTNKFVVTDNAVGISAPDSGYVGIGTATPAAALHIEGLINFPTRMKAITKDVHANGSAAGGGLFFGHVNTDGTSSMPAANDRLGYVLFGTVDPGGVDRFGAGFQVKATADWTYVGGAVTMPSVLQLHTTDTTGTRKVRLIVAPNGNVAVGQYNGPMVTSNATAFPTQTLEVNGGIRLNPAALAAGITAPVKTCATDADRGTLWFVNNGAAKDVLQICAFNGTSLGWQQVW